MATLIPQALSMYPSVYTVPEPPPPLQTKPAGTTPNTYYTSPATSQTVTQQTQPAGTTPFPQLPVYTVPEPPPPLQTQPSWLGDWQNMQNQFNAMMQQWNTQQQVANQAQSTYGYNYQPQYQNALMRPVTPTSNVGKQQTPMNMGYQNRTSLWSNV